jgi:hypothetical protein
MCKRIVSCVYVKERSDYVCQCLGTQKVSLYLSINTRSIDESIDRSIDRSIELKIKRWIH